MYSMHAILMALGLFLFPPIDVFCVGATVMSGGMLDDESSEESTESDDASGESAAP